MARRKLTPATPDEVRAWAKANNVPVPDKGRLPNVVAQQFSDETGRAILPSARTQSRKERAKPQTVDASEPAPISRIEVSSSYGKEPGWIVVGRRRAQARAMERKTFIEV